MLIFFVRMRIYFAPEINIPNSSSAVNWTFKTRFHVPGSSETNQERASHATFLLSKLFSHNLTSTSVGTTPKRGPLSCVTWEILPRKATSIGTFWVAVAQMLSPVCCHPVRNCLCPRRSIVLFGEVGLPNLVCGNVSARMYLYTRTQPLLQSAPPIWSNKNFTDIL